MLYSMSLYRKGKRQNAPTTGPPSTEKETREIIVAHTVKYHFKIQLKKMSLEKIYFALRI